MRDPNEHGLNHLLRAGPVVIYTREPSGDGPYTFVSPSITSQLGYEPRELVEDRSFWARHIHPDDAPSVLAEMPRLLEQGSHVHEYRFRHKDGTYRWMLSQSILSRDEAGNPVEVVGYAVDVTEYKRAEEVLWSISKGTSSTVGEAQFFRSLVQHMAAALHVKYAFISELADGDGKRVRMISWWTGEDWGESIHYDTKESPCEHVVAKKLAYYPTGVQNLFPRDIWLKDHKIDSYFAVPLFDSAGKALGHMGVMHDGPMNQVLPIEPILRIFAGRAAAEVERKRADEALAAVQYELEIRVRERTKDLAASNVILKSEITERQRAERLQAGQNRVLKLLAKGGGLPEVLDELARTIETQHRPGILCSILLLDAEARLGQSIGPNLPREYMDVIDGLEIGPNVGSCGTAAYRRERVVVNDIETDPLWAGYRELAKRFGLRACWSQPILSESGEVLGTFAMYFSQPYHPNDAELLLLDEAAYLAGVAIEHTKAKEALQQSESALRQSHSELQNLTAKLFFAREEERRRLARELHDDLTQRLAVLAIEAGKLEKDSQSDPFAISARLRKIKEQVVQLSTDVHGISRQLHSSILDDLGLVDALESECAVFSEREGVQVDFTADQVPPALPQDVSLCLYRIAQESLRNIAKHARVKEARVRVGGVNGCIVLSIQDSGVGFDRERARRKPSLGLASMEERVRLIGGTLSVDSRPGRGTMVEVRKPLTGGMYETAAAAVGG